MNEHELGQLGGCEARTWERILSFAGKLPQDPLPRGRLTRAGANVDQRRQNIREHRGADFVDLHMASEDEAGFAVPELRERAAAGPEYLPRVDLRSTRIAGDDERDLPRQKHIAGLEM